MLLPGPTILVYYSLTSVCVCACVCVYMHCKNVVVISTHIAMWEVQKTETKGVTEVLLTNRYWEGNIISHVGSTENGKQRV